MDGRLGILAISVLTAAIVILGVVIGPVSTVIRNYSKGIPLGDIALFDPYAAANRPDASRSKERVSPAVAAPLGTGGYTFVTEVEGLPVRYDPCRVIRYVIRAQDASPAMITAVGEAAREASAATGLRFQYDGLVDEAPTDGRAPFQPDRYGNTWAPILIAFSDPTEGPRLAGDTIGLGGSVSVVHGSVGDERATFVSGQVWLDTPQLLETRRPVHMTKHVALHEIGHVLGLDHVDDPLQVMHQGGGDHVTFGDGDRRGLAILGDGPCAPEL